MQLIAENFAIRLHVRSVGNYLRRWDFTPQKPIRRTYEQSPQAVAKWLDQLYREIARGARKADAEIHWGVETALVNTVVRGRNYVPRGKTPVRQAEGGTREKMLIIATVTNQGKARRIIINGAFKHGTAHRVFQIASQRCTKQGLLDTRQLASASLQAG